MDQAGEIAAHSQAVREIPDLVPLVDATPEMAEIVAALQRGESGTIDGAWGSARALAASVFVPHCSGMLVVVAPRATDMDELIVDLTAFLGEEPAVFPAIHGVPADWNLADPQYGSRLQLLKRLHQAGDETLPERPAFPRCLVTSIEALLQPVPSHQQLREFTRTLKVGDELDLEEWSHWLVERGFERTTAIELPGEFAIHGGILDLFPTDSLAPLRIELFGDEVESIRTFDVESQRKIDTLKQVQLTLFPAQEAVFGDQKKRKDNKPHQFGQHFATYLPEDSWFVLSELQELLDEGKLYLERLDSREGLFHVQAAMEACTAFPSVSISAISGGSFEKTCDLRTESIERFSVGQADPLTELEQALGIEERGLICCLNEGERSRIAELIDEKHPELKAKATLTLGRCSKGFRLVRQRMLVVSDHELYGRRDVRPNQKRKTIQSRAIESFLELSEGDLVVHVGHGIGIFRGMQLIRGEDRTEEHLVLEFADNVRIFVPVSLIHLVQKYVGASKAFPRLSKIGSNSWGQKKKKVSQAVADMAADMIKLQATREAKKGIAYPGDSHWYEEFEQAFPYEETPDQATAIDSIREDMMRERPMDRLICGDVGYGKTEVAMRAAFRAIDSGKQAAVLVPTTVLAEQHYRSFCARMAEFPYNIEMLSRFRSKKEQKAILEGLEAGTIDLVVGTHRIVSPDIKFKDLGLVIIDEEQRFGVKAKEMLKRLRLEVDILTLSATPIPRTLHMSLLGIRDISNLQTPPRGRQAIETRICRWDPELIRHAIVRELNRNGQVYFVHNRVYDIEELTEKLQQIVPEAKFGIVHGQMSESELEKQMVAFVRGKTDVLMATTIIESGLDIPNANTMFIHEADRYGLADMHQLRGRVGRFKHRAYCYLVVEEGKVLSTTSTRRLKAIEEYSELGAGFKIAMRDLEIRGAGNILGTEQSGHISLVGYELYCQLLENAVREQKNEAPREHPHVNLDLPVTGFLPNDYIPPGRAKIELYRKLSAVGDLQQLADLTDELQDRFGTPPVPVQKLLALKELQILARVLSISQIHLEGKFFVFTGKKPQWLRAYKELSPHDLRLVDKKTIYVPVPGDLDPESDDYEQNTLQFIKSVLQDRKA
ncbi:transcription-repair coupling factor [Rubinisphaera sp. JC750]|uniref:transcription-repair coupling factor n=1 Tax=Rubinisphaera sp. JC750 TaxID=2898658 RepID=UPI001F023471|nr:transcription-repair coupling factor [Rubinisphaera sp. JC750]